MVTVCESHTIKRKAWCQIYIYQFQFEYFIAAKKQQKVQTRCITAYRGVFTSKYTNHIGLQYIIYHIYRHKSFYLNVCFSVQNVDCCYISFSDNAQYVVVEYKFCMFRLVGFPQGAAEVIRTCLTAFYTRHAQNALEPC